jgi:hypothetical protein
MQRAMTNNKAATDYLHVSGAVPIRITQTDGVCSFRPKIDPNNVSTH